MKLRNGTKIEIKPNGSCVVLPCGLVVEGRPHDTESYCRASAGRKGSMPRLIATKPLRYDRRDLNAGDAFEASEVDARILCAVGRAEIPPAAVPEPAALIEHDEIEVADTPPPRRRYRRRDLRAED